MSIMPTVSVVVTVMSVVVMMIVIVESAKGVITERIPAVAIPWIPAIPPWITPAPANSPPNVVVGINTSGSHINWSGVAGSLDVIERRFSFRRRHDG